MKKIIKKIGNSLGIIFNKEECKVWDLKEGEVLEIDDTVIIKQKGKGANIYLNLQEGIAKDIEAEANEKNTTPEEIIRERLLGGIKCKKK